MKAIKQKLGKHTLYLAFDGEAMFIIEEKHGGVKELTDKLLNSSRESFTAVCETAALFAERGELARRYYGYDPQEFVEATEIMQILQPAQIIELKGSVISAIELGFGREIKDEEKEVDLGLLELNEQKKTT